MKHKNSCIYNKKIMSYIGIFTVIFIWGLCPLITKELNRHYSPTFKVAVTEVILLITYFFISGKNIKKFNKGYLKPGLITGVFLGLANITQKPLQTLKKYSKIHLLYSSLLPLYLIETTSTINHS